jgi:hypothetical protein
MTITISTVISAIKRHLSIIGKRLYNKEGKNMFSDITLSSAEDTQILTQYITTSAQNVEALLKQFITASTINNYVRTKVMPMPVKKKYYRTHLAYLIMICSLKQGMSLSLIQRLIPSDLDDQALEAIYASYVQRHSLAIHYFGQQVRMAAAPILGHEADSPLASDRTEDMIAASAVVGGFARLLAEKLLLLEGQTRENEVEA